MKNVSYQIKTALKQLRYRTVKDLYLKYSSYYRKVTIHLISPLAELF